MAFIKTGEALNRYWMQMLDAQLEYDTRAVYLLTFETALDSCLLSSLYDHESYKAQVQSHPIKVGGEDRVDLEVYRSWILCFARIMRENSLLGIVANGADLADDAAEDFFDLGGDDGA